MILNKHKNMMLAAVQECGLDPDLFASQTAKTGEDDYFVVNLRGSTLTFSVSTWRGAFSSFGYCYSQFSSGYPVSVVMYAETAALLAERLRNWLRSVVIPYLEDLNTPDLWESLSENRARAVKMTASSGDFVAYSDEEKLQIRLSLRDFRRLLVKNFKPVEEELSSINERLDYLSAALDKHNRFDWKGIAINTVLSIGIALSLSAEQGAKLWELFRQIFAHIVYLGTGV